MGRIYWPEQDAQEEVQEAQPPSRTTLLLKTCLTTLTMLITLTKKTILTKRITPSLKKHLRKHLRKRLARPRRISPGRMLKGKGKQLSRNQGQKRGKVAAQPSANIS